MGGHRGPTHTSVVAYARHTMQYHATGSEWRMYAYLVLLEDLAKRGDLRIYEPVECLSVLTAFFDLRLVLGETPLALGRQATCVGAFKQ